LKKFLGEISLFLGLVLVFLLPLEFLLRKPNADSIAAKQIILEDNITSLKTLVLGSSHALTGVNPVWLAEGAVNAANTSQPFYYDFQILKKTATRAPNLQNVVLPLSQALFFYKIEERQEHLYYLYADLPPHSGKYDFESFSAVLALGLENGLKALKNKEDLATSKGWKEEQVVFDGSAEKLERRIEVMHSKMDTAAQADNVRWLREVIGFCKKNRLRLVLYHSPECQAMRSALAHDEPYRSRFDAAMADLKKDTSLEIYDFNDGTFGNELFRDADHLNAAGAKVLSQKLKAVLEGKPDTVLVKKTN
jgi:hypothetical protein